MEKGLVAIYCSGVARARDWMGTFCHRVMWSKTRECVQVALPELSPYPSPGHLSPI